MSRSDDVELQLSEIEMLKSMFPEENAVAMDDVLTFAQLKSYAEQSGSDPRRSLIVSLKLPLTEADCFLHITFTLPVNYPSTEQLSVLIRCNKMNKTQHRDMNDDVKNYITSLGVGDLCLYQVVEWLTENGKQYVTIEEKEDNSLRPCTSKEEQTFSRLWIYSHHIYSKTKRKNILDWAKELELTGFSMPGKPGVVCVEGTQQNCEEFWQRMKRQTWKRLSLVHIEEGVFKDGSQKFEKKFIEPVVEKDFGVHGGRDYHMDLGQFASYLADHQSHHLFSILFGVEGKVDINKDDR